MMRSLLLALLSLGPVLAACGDNQTFPIDRAPYGEVEIEPFDCIPNLDGAIGGPELAPTLDQVASYIVTPPALPDATSGRPVDLTGRVDETGRRIWDWAAVDSDERVADIIGVPLDGQWFQSSFSGGEFVVPSDLGGALLAVYSVTSEAILLHGIASADAGPPEGQTLLVYESPVALFRFPFSVGSAWSETGIIRNGTLRGLTPWSQDDVYEIMVDAAGELRLPDFTFTQALRLQTKVTVLPKVGNREGYSQRQTSFMFECFGEVARATSLLFSQPADDPGVEFDEAIEVRKLGWF